MAKWRDIPTTLSWDGENLTPATVQPRPQRVRPSKVSTPVVTPTKTEVPETPSEGLGLEKLSGLSDEEKVAALRTEAALDAVLGLIPEGDTAVAEPQESPEPEPAENAASKVSGTRTDSDVELWENPVQDLPMGNSAIYPDGRPLSNPNHLMLFVRRGAEVLRSYMQTGWVSVLHRTDGKRNPVPESLVETLISSGILRESRPGIFRGD